MPKVDTTRNYYADLDLPPSATAQDIKSQFKKLALKYHPDRNPGHEDEFITKFQNINSAHEILTDDGLKRKYDDSLRSRASRNPTSSGVRGNPWQDVGKNYPPPPRRNAAAAAAASSQNRPASGPQARTGAGAQNRPNAGTQNRPASGAQRYSNFTGSTRAGKPAPKEDPETRKWNYQAWESMRPSSRGQNNPPPVPGRAPTSATRDTKAPNADSIPRTASQKQKAQASFGNTNRRAGFTPSSPGPGDEPPVTNKNYFTNRTHTNIFEAQEAQEAADAAAHKSRKVPPIVDPLAQFKGQFADGRQSTPYTTPGGEKTSLFQEGAGVNRSRSTREPNRDTSGERPANGAFPFPRARARAASTPRSSSNDGGSEDSARASPGGTGGGNRRSPNINSATSSRTSDRYKPKPSGNTAGEKPTSSPGTDADGNAAQTDGGPSVYAQTPIPFYSSHSTCSHTNLQSEKSKLNDRGFDDGFTKLYRPFRLHTNDSSSGATDAQVATLSPVEKLLKKDVEQLVQKKSGVALSKSLGNITRAAENTTRGVTSTENKTHADNSLPRSFNFSGNGSNTGSPQVPHRFASNSAENINTRFVNDDHPDDWEFKAGSASANESFTPSKMRSQSGSRIGRRSSPANKANPRPRPTARPSASMPASKQGSEESLKTGFQAGEWSEKIGSHHFDPPPPQSTSASPTRRANSRKNSKPIKMTMGTAGLVDEESSAGEGWQEIPHPAGTDSPNAMDIDSPPPEKTDDTPKAAARNIRVEPSKPEWRAGAGDGIAHPKSAHPTVNTDAATLGFGEKPAAGSTSAPTTANPFATRTGGSEDTEEFRTTFSEFKNVEPFKDPAPSGLKSFADLKSTLPFDSKPSEQIPIQRDPPQIMPLVFPNAPVAPRLPPTMAVPGIRPNVTQFRQYARDFYNYMDKWEAFNQMVLDHFTARQAEFKQRRQQNGHTWLDSLQGGDGARMYQGELDQDHEVRKQWGKVCDEHQMRVREFTAFRDRVK